MPVKETADDRIEELTKQLNEAKFTIEELEKKLNKNLRYQKHEEFSEVSLKKDNLWRRQGMALARINTTHFGGAIN